MSRVWSVAIVVLAAGAMWLAVGWPGVDKELPEAKEAVASEETPKAVALQQTPKQDAAAPEPEEPVYDEPAPPPAPAAPPAPLGQPADLLAGQKGPVEEYQSLYNRQTRDSAATEIEKGISDAFTKHSTRPDLLHSASCREGVCKVLIRWSPDRTRDYLQSMRWLALGTPWPPGQPGFDSQIAYTGASEKDKDGGRLVEVYLKRMPPSAAKPAAHSH